MRPLLHLGPNVITDQPVPGSQIVQCGRIKTSKAKIRRARLGKGGGGGEKNGRESLLAFSPIFVTSGFGCQNSFEIWVLRASVFVFECFVFETTELLVRMCGNLCLRIHYPARTSGFFGSSFQFHPPKRRPEIHLLFAGYEFVNGVCESRPRSFKVLQVLQ